MSCQEPPKQAEKCGLTTAEQSVADETPSKPPAFALPPTLLVRPEPAAAMLGIGRTLLDDLNKLSLCPAPVRMPSAKRRRKGSAVASNGMPRYRVADLELWAELGCPDRKTFEAEKQARTARAARRRA